MDTRTAGYGYRPSSSGFRSQSWSSRSPAAAATSMSISSSSYKRSLNAPPPMSDYNQNLMMHGDFQKRSNEKEQLQGLNDRFAGYIDKVHFLEQQNQQIEAEIQALRQKQASRGQLGDAYDAELTELRATLEQIHRDKAQAELDTERMEDDARRLRERGDEEARIREETEAIVRVLQRERGDCELARGELGKKAQALQDEIAFIRSNHEEEVSELSEQVQHECRARDVERRRDFPKSDITEALREIRCELEGHSSQNLQQVEQLFMGRYSKLTEAAEHNKDAIKCARDEISDYRRQLQSKTVELESVRGTRDSLERQLSDIEDRHTGDLSSLQVTMDSCV